MAALFVLFFVLLALATVLSILNHRDMPAYSRNARMWPGSRRHR
jgi:hypothetical protein